MGRACCQQVFDTRIPQYWGHGSCTTTLDGQQAAGYSNCAITADNTTGRSGERETPSSSTPRRCNREDYEEQQVSDVGSGLGSWQLVWLGGS